MYSQTLVFGLYARKSSEDSGKQIESIESQMDYLHKQVRNERLNVVKEYSESRSAFKPNNRPEFDQMVKDLKQGKINAIYTWKADRLARNPEETGIVIGLFQSRILKEIHTSQKTYTNPLESFMLYIEMGMGNQYSLDMGHNVVRGMKTKFEKGGCNHLAPLGYRNATHQNRKTIEKDEVTYPLVRKLFELYGQGNNSLQILADTANEWGLKTKYGNPLSIQTLSKMLQNPFYKGKVRLNGEYRDGIHEPMVSATEFEQVQSIMKRAGRIRKAVTNYEFPFTGVLSCGECGCSVTAEVKLKYKCPHCGACHTKKSPTICAKCGKSFTLEEADNLKRYRHYHCTKRKNKNGDYKCQQKGIAEKVLINAFVEEFIKPINLSEELLQCMKEWLDYIRESYEGRKESGKESFLKQKKKLEKKLVNLSER